MSSAVIAMLSVKVLCGSPSDSINNLFVMKKIMSKAVN